MDNLTRVLESYLVEIILETNDEKENSLQEVYAQNLR